MFGIGGGELIFIIFIALMLFGSEKIPDVARTMGKAMAQFKNASNEIKNEIQKGVQANGLDTSLNEFTKSFSSEVEQIKSNLETNITPEIDKLNEGLEDLSGPIKRQR